MDAKWFKDQLKKVNATAADIATARGRARSNVSHILNGKQGMSLDWAKAFSLVLQVPVSTILDKAGATDPVTAQQLSPGFADSDAAAWVPGAELGLAAQVKSAAALFGGDRPGVDVWQVRSKAMAFEGLKEGDFMLVDTHQAERVKPGDLVVAQIYNRTGATTVLRRFEPPVLISSGLHVDGRVNVVDGVNVVIRGKVIASWRV